jgi:hypothetical protein
MQASLLFAQSKTNAESLFLGINTRLKALFLTSLHFIYFEGKLGHDCCEMLARMLTTRAVVFVFAILHATSSSHDV